MAVGTVSVRIEVARAYRDAHFVEVGERLPAAFVEPLDPRVLSIAGRQALLVIDRQQGQGMVTLPDPESLAIVPSTVSGPLWRWLAIEASESVDTGFVATVLDRFGRRIEQLLPEYDRAVEAHRLRQEEQAAAKLQDQQDRVERSRQLARERAREDAEKARWIQERGSAYLKRAVAAGHDCQRQYASERAACELPDYELDFDLKASWEERSCPSAAALDEAERAQAAGLSARVVWQTRGPDGWDLDSGVEAVLVRGFLGSYRLWRSLGDPMADGTDESD